jgi:hypothetical protein
MTNPEAGGWIGRWSPGIGDPSVAGWATVVLYVAAAWTCMVVALQLRPEVKAGKVSQRERLAWLSISVFLWLLAVNKQLDFQTAFTEVGRMLARRQGWYHTRAHVQKVFIGSLCGAGLACVLTLMVVLRRLGFAVKTAALGMCFIGLFVLARASSFHHVDQFLGHRLVHLRMNWILEMGGILVVLGAARMRRMRPTGLASRGRVCSGLGKQNGMEMREP